MTMAMTRKNESVTGENPECPECVEPDEDEDEDEDDHECAWCPHQKDGRPL